MFTGKKITTGTTTKLEPKLQKTNPTKITQQIVGKPKRTVASPDHMSAGQNEGLKTKQNRSKGNRSISRQQKKVQTSHSQLEVKTNRSSQIVNELKFSQKGMEKFQVLDQEWEEEQSQLSGEQDFIQYNQQEQDEEEEQRRVLPTPFQEINFQPQELTASRVPQDQLNASFEEMGFNMEVFSLQAEEIMAKPYFVI